MARDLTDAFSDAIVLRQTLQALLVQLTFRSQTVYCWSGKGVLSWNGNQFLGLGQFGEISTISETATVEAQGVSLDLTAIPISYTLPDGTPLVSLLTESLGDVQLGSPVKIWYALFDQTGTLIANPAQAYSGRMDQPEVNADGETFSVHLAVENRLTDLQRGQNRRYTQMDQQLDYPEDSGMQYMSGMVDWNGAWGSS